MFTIQQDTREQAGKKNHILEHFEKLGIKVVRSKLYVGDWTRLDKQDVVIDTKKDVLELLQNLNQGHTRFKTECIKAQQNGIRLIVLIEEMPPNNDIRNWKSPIYKSDGYRVIKGKKVKTHRKGDKISNASPNYANQAMFTMTQKYGVEFMFCEKSDTAKKMLELLGCQDAFEKKKTACATDLADYFNELKRR